MTIEKILVPVDFSPCSDAALDYALEVADATGAEVEMLHVWAGARRTIFADTHEGAAMEERLSRAESEHLARVSGRLEFGDEAAGVILGILAREGFDLVVMGREGDGRRSEGHVASAVASDAPCTVVTLPPDETEAA